MATPLRPVRRRASHAALATSFAIALALHLMLIAGIDWPRFAAPPSATIDLTLTGFGKAAATVREPPVSPPAKPAAASQPTISPANRQQTVAESTPTDPDKADLLTTEAAPSSRPSLPSHSIDDLVRAVADAGSAEERLAAVRTTRLDDAPMRADFAYYLESWRRKVERIGKLNYPRQARAERMTGSLRLRVVIAADGALRDVRVVQSSGHQLLDDAALHIVRLASPYAPFSPAMRDTTDVLEIERTWRFLNNEISS